MYNYKNYLITALVTLFASCSLMLQAACVDTVVLVHGNTATPASWNNTYNYLLTKGYSSSDIYRPDWGSKSCAACNDHSGSEETPIRNALESKGSVSLICPND